MTDASGIPADDFRRLLELADARRCTLEAGYLDVTAPVRKGDDHYRVKITGLRLAVVVRDRDPGRAIRGAIAALEALAEARR